MNTVIPSNVMKSNSILNSALNLDVMAFIKPWEHVKIKYDENGGTIAQQYFSDQVRDLGYETPNFLKNMPTYNIFLFYYWCKAFLLALLFIIGRYYEN